MLVLLSSTAPAFAVRLGALAPLIGCLHGIILSASQTLGMASAGLVCGTAGFCLLHYLDITLLRWPSAAKGKPSTLAKAAQRPRTKVVAHASQLRRAAAALCNFRKVNTPFEVKNVPSFSGNVAPAYSAFVRSSSISAMVCFLVLDLASLVPPAPPGIDPFAPDKVPLFRGMLEGTITADDIITRCVGCTGHWLLTYCLLRGCYDACSALLVACHLSSPVSCRPLFGHLRHASTIRGFWGKTWHQLVRDPCGQPAAFITRHILHLKCDNARLASIYVRLFLTFAFSGLIHTAADIAAGIPSRESGTLRFLLMQALGITVEDAAVELWSRTLATQRPHAPRFWHASLGHIWLGLWLFWTTPTWCYPAARFHDGTSLLPFSVLRPFLAVFPF